MMVDRSENIAITNAIKLEHNGPYMINKAVMAFETETLVRYPARQFYTPGALNQPSVVKIPSTVPTDINAITITIKSV